MFVCMYVHTCTQTHTHWRYLRMCNDGDDRSYPTLTSAPCTIDTARMGPGVRKCQKRPIYMVKEAYEH